MEDLLARVRRFARRYDLLPSHGDVVAGVSGGPDSLCLLHVLLDLATEYGYTLHAAHLDHGLRGEESAADARFVAETAAASGLPCTLGRADVAGLAKVRGLSLEEAARQARYRFLAETARAAGAATVAVGHNAGDQAETVLMHFLRGSGPAGLRGMLPKTGMDAWEVDAAPPSPAGPALLLVRPLLEIPRPDIEAYCAAHGLRPRHDASNDDTSLFRNHLRHDLLPLLEAYNPRLEETLAHTAAVMAGDYEVLTAAVDAAWARATNSRAPAWSRETNDDAFAPSRETNDTPGVTGDETGRAEIRLDLQQWRDLPLGLQRATLRRAISGFRRSLRDVSWEHVERAVWLARKGTTGQRATLSAGLALEIGYDALHVGPEVGLPAEPGRASPPAVEVMAAYPQLSGPVALAVPGVTDLPGGWRVTVRRVSPIRSGQSVDHPWSATLDAAAAGPVLTLRPRLPGDRFRPLGLGGHSVKLNEFMIDVKLPRAARAGWPILAGREGIAWVCGLRLDEHVAVRPDTGSGYHIDIAQVSA